MGKKTNLMQLVEDRKLSVKAYNICSVNGLHTIGDLIDYYQFSKDFSVFRSCGKKTQMELSSFCENNKQLDIIINQKSEKSKDFQYFKSLGVNKLELLAMYVEYKVKQQEVRASNVIHSIWGNQIDLVKLMKHCCLDKGYSFKNIKNVGRKTKGQLDIFCEDICSFFHQIQLEDSDKEIELLYNEFWMKNTYYPYFNHYSFQVDSVFELIDLLLKKNRFKQKLKSEILKKVIKVYRDTPTSTLDEIASEFGYTRERIRQLRHYYVTILTNLFGDISAFKDNVEENYGIDLSQNILWINKTEADYINEFNQTQFHNEFITLILYLYLSEQFELIGKLEEAITHSFSEHRSKHNWKHIYLVKKDQSRSFDFEKLLNDFYLLTMESINQDYTIGLENIIHKYSDQDTNEPRLKEVIKEILSNELDVVVEEDAIRFKRNRLKRVAEYAYEALEKIGREANVSEIYEKVKEMNPHWNKSEESIRSSMKRKDGFVPIGRSSKFGLKKWENQKEKFMGGTIREISESFLNQKDTPVGIEELTAYVVQFRPKTNEKNIYYNLKLDTSGTFSFFKNSHIGLSSKNYPDTFVELVRGEVLVRKSWDTSFEQLKEFIETHNRRPKYGENLSQEKSLYRWLSVQKSRINKDKLDPSKKDKLIRLLSIEETK